jgi:arsenate reductase
VKPAPKTRVLFVCIGNSCRSQMAEGFARAYGGDVLVPASAGLAPAPGVARNTIRTMEEKNIDLREHFPKGLKQLGRAEFDLIVNMSGCALPDGVAAPARDWDVPDPIGEDYETYCRVRDEIESRVMGLILELRRARKAT